MNISPISYNSKISLKASSTNQQRIKPERQMIGNTKIPYTPATIGVLNGALWTGIGLASDKAFAFIFRSERKLKSSLIVNGIIGLGMGTYAYVQARKDFKKTNVNPSQK